MKFDYEYRSSDNALHKGVVRAPNRDAAYSQLRAQGIRPSRMQRSAGFWNAVLGGGKRWIAIGGLTVLSVTLFFLFARTSKSLETLQATSQFIDGCSRRQPIGDRAEIEKGVATGWRSVFAHEGERFLASFAVPGEKAAVRSTTEGEIRSALSRTVAVDERDALEVRQIKQIVEGMKRELRAYIEAGGSIRSYGERLVERQEYEIALYCRAESEIASAVRQKVGREVLLGLWDDRNADLKKLGIRPIPLPELSGSQVEEN